MRETVAELLKLVGQNQARSYEPPARARNVPFKATAWHGARKNGSRAVKLNGRGPAATRDTIPLESGSQDF
jgi:hypothetical protein